MRLDCIVTKSLGIPYLDRIAGSLHEQQNTSRAKKRTAHKVSNSALYPPACWSFSVYIHYKVHGEISQCKIILPCSCFIHARLIARPGLFSSFFFHFVCCFSLEQNNTSPCLPSDVYSGADRCSLGKALNPGGPLCNESQCGTFNNLKSMRTFEPDARRALLFCV